MHHRSLSLSLSLFALSWWREALCSAAVLISGSFSPSLTHLLPLLFLLSHLDRRHGTGWLDGRAGNDSVLKKTLKEIDTLHEDIGTISSMSELAASLSCAHASLEESLKDLLLSLNRQLSEKQNSDSQLLTLELTITSQ